MREAIIQITKSELKDVLDLPEDFEVGVVTTPIDYKDVIFIRVSSPRLYDTPVGAPLVHMHPDTISEHLTILAEQRLQDNSA
jgi:hypothetical protein